jgi:ketosteroid isomerase-like protein
VSAENVELVRRMIDLWNEGDWDAVIANYDDAVVLEDELLPDGGVYEGVQAVRARFEDVRSLAGKWKVETQTILDAGADVVWVSRAWGQLNEDIPPFDFLAGTVFSFEGGRVVRIRWFATPEKALEAAGL